MSLTTTQIFEIIKEKGPQTTRFFKELEWNDYKGNLTPEGMRNHTYKRLSRLEAAGRLTKEVRDGDAYWGLPE